MRLLVTTALLLLCVTAGRSEFSDASTRAATSPATFRTWVEPSRQAPVSRQPTRPMPPVLEPITVQQILRSSAMIFSGTVLNVEHQAAGSGTARGITQIIFRVQDAIRGVRPGQVIELREWGGLWNAGDRYRPGETLFLFLYPPSKLGLTSPVGGAAGKFRMQSGRVLIGPQHTFFRSQIVTETSPKLKDFFKAIRRAQGE